MKQPPTKADDEYTSEDDELWNPYKEKPKGKKKKGKKKQSPAHH